MEDIYRKCMYCNHIYVSDSDAWIPEKFYELPKGALLSHGLCPSQRCILEYAIGFSESEEDIELNFEVLSSPSD